MKEEEKSGLLEEIASERKRRIGLESEVERLKTKPKTPAEMNVMRLGDISENIGHQIASSRQKVAKRSRGVSLSNIRVELKGYAMNEDGELAVAIPGAKNTGDLPPGELVSTFHIDYNNAATPQMPDNTGLQPVPSVIGRTILMARRILERAGFLAIVQYRTVKTHKRHGRVQSQSIEPNTQAKSGSRVTISVGKQLITEG